MNWLARHSNITMMFAALLMVIVWSLGAVCNESMHMIFFCFGLMIYVIGGTIVATNRAIAKRKSCSSCGAIIRPSYIYCGNCGAKLK